MTTIKIRNYQDDDSSNLEQLLKDAGIYYASLDKVDFFKKFRKFDPEAMILAEDDDKLVGTVFMLYTPWHSCIYHLGVHPDYRNKGIGSKLMDEVEGILKSRGIEEVTLFVDVENTKAIEFYKKRGWEICNKNYAMLKKL